MIMYKFLSVILLLTITTFASAQTVPKDEEKLFHHQGKTQKWLADNKIPALGIGYIKNGKLQTIKVFGEHKKGESASSNAIFNVASLTKPITAMIALKLVSSGKWNLDEPLSNYWVDPDIINDERHKKLTTRIVLSHQTGFANWRWLNQSNKLEFAFEPGTKYQYSGEGFEYLRRALEKKFNKTLDKLAKELIFQPLKMWDTELIWSNKIDEKRFAVGYDKNQKAYEIFKRKEASAADDLLTTIEDYGKFLMAVINRKGLSKKIFNEMICPQIKTKENKYFGLGWEIYDLGNQNYALSHGGSDQGTQTVVFLLPKTKEGLLIFTNSDNGTNAYLPVIIEYLKETGKRIIEIEMK